MPLQMFLSATKLLRERPDGGPHAVYESAASKASLLSSGLDMPKHTSLVALACLFNTNRLDVRLSPEQLDLVEGHSEAITLQADWANEVYGWPDGVQVAGLVRALEEMVTVFDTYSEWRGPDSMHSTVLGNEVFKEISRIKT